MSGAARRSAEKEAFWRLVFEEHRASGQSVRAFCQQESLSEASFYAWRKELERRDHGIKQTREQSCSDRDFDDPQPAMIPVNVVGDATSLSPIVSASSTCSLEVLTPSGFTLRFDHQIDPARLRVLLQTIASCGSGVASC